MKLINLIITIFLMALDGLYYIIASPVLVPIAIHRWNKNRVWREKASIGDQCFFINVKGRRTECRITDKKDKRVLIQGSNLRGSFSRWEELDNLRVV